MRGHANPLKWFSDGMPAPFPSMTFLGLFLKGGFAFSPHIPGFPPPPQAIAGKQSPQWPRL
jgi:hypothetical protein